MKKLLKKARALREQIDLLRDDPGDGSRHRLAAALDEFLKLDVQRAGGFFPGDTLDRVRSANDIVEVVNEYFPLGLSLQGDIFMARCPFHKENTPSFAVNAKRQIFHCFGCHAGGDVFAFVQKYENLTFVEAVRKLAKRAGVEV